MASVASTPSSPPTMRAWTYSRSGHPSKVLSLSSNTKIPSLSSPSDVLIRVNYAAFNPGSSIIMQLFPYIFRPGLTVAESDFSGTVVETGAEVPVERELLPGTAVFGAISVALHLGSGRGALAEYVVVPAKSVIKKPSKAALSMVAGLPVAGCTAVALIKNSRLKKGDLVLVNGASGGIGHMALQMVKDIVGESGNVVAVCSSRNMELVSSLGADEVIDYEAHAPVHQYLASKYKDTRFNVVIDAYGVEDIFLNCASYLRSDGAYVTVGRAFHEYAISSGTPRKYVQVTGVENLKDMLYLAKLVEEEKLKVAIDSTWKMEDVLQAYERVLSRRSSGKVLVQICEE